MDDSGEVPANPDNPEQAVSHPDAKPQIEDPNRPKVCPSNLITTLLTGEFVDIHFVVDGQTFPAHRAVLAARSSMFRSEFLALQDNMGHNGVFVSIQHIDALTFKYLLHFIYTDSLPPDFEEAIASQQKYRSLFIEAHRFKVEGLKIICEEKLTEAVTHCILSTLDVINFQDSGLLKIVQKDGNMKPEIITSTAPVQKVGDPHKIICEKKLTATLTDCTLSYTLNLIDFQDYGLLNIVQKDCNSKPERIISTTKEQKVGDRLYSTSILTKHLGEISE